MPDLNPEIRQYRAVADCREGFEPDQADLNVGGRDVEIRLQRGQTFAGRILDSETGRPIPDAEVYAHRRDFEPGERYGYEAERKTDEAGRFRFSNLPAGDWTLGVRDTNPAAELNFTTPSAPKQSVDVRVTPGPFSRLKPAGP